MEKLKARRLNCSAVMVEHRSRAGLDVLKVFSIAMCCLYLFQCMRSAEAQYLPLSGGSLSGPLTGPRINGVLNPLTFSGSDLGAQIINALASSSDTYKTLVIPGSGSPHTWSTEVTIDPRYVSIRGEGSGTTFISCTASPCLSVHENTFSTDPGGVIGGFTMAGNGSASQIGIQSSGVQDQRWDDITLTGFTGAGAVSWYLYNSNSANGWAERIHATKIRVENGAGLKFAYNTSNAGAASFGYSDFDVTCDTQGAGQTCFQVASGRLYGSDIHIQGNIYETGVLLEALTGSYPGDMDENRYLIQAEPLNNTIPGTCVHTGLNAEISGVGTVICNGSAITDDNGISFNTNLRIVPADVYTAGSVIGLFSDFNGTGNSATAFMGMVYDLHHPYSQFGTIHGPYVDSTYSASQTQPGNGHFFYSCPPTYAGGLTACTPVAQVLNTGIINASAGFSTGGTVGFTGTAVAGRCILTINGGIITRADGC